MVFLVVASSIQKISWMFGHLLVSCSERKKCPGRLAMLPRKMKQEFSVHEDNGANRKQQHEQKKKKRLRIV